MKNLEEIRLESIRKYVSYLEQDRHEAVISGNKESRVSIEKELFKMYDRLEQLESQVSI